MRFADNREALHATTKDATVIEPVMSAAMNPLTRAAIDAAVKKVREGLQVEAAGIFKPWNENLRTCLEDAVSMWLTNQFESYLKREEIDRALEIVFDDVLEQEINDELKESVNYEVTCAMRDRGQW